MIDKSTVTTIDQLPRLTKAQLPRLTKAQLPRLTKAQLPRLTLATVDNFNLFNFKGRPLVFNSYYKTINIYMWLLLEQFLSKYAVSPNLAHTVHVLNASPFLIVFFGNHYFIKRPQIVFIRCEKMPSTSIFVVQILILNHF